MSVQDLITSHYKFIMGLLNIEPNSNNEKTPERVAKMLLEVFENVGKDPMTDLLPQMSLFPATNKEGYVEVKDIPLVSFCSHHHLPFIGKAKVKYNPNEYVIGLSKIPRVIEWFSRKPQLQEDLTNEIGEFLVKVIKPNSLIVTIYDCMHTCATCRGVRSIGMLTDTTYYYSEGIKDEC